jgi:RNA polymerase sigma factor (TIGR02999 family)
MPRAATAPDFNQLLDRARTGDTLAKGAVYRLAFLRLRAMASAMLNRERPGHTLQPTALVSELYLKFRRFEARILNEEHFFSLSARIMRQVLIEHARGKNARKRIPPEMLCELIPELAQNAVVWDAEGSELRISVKAAFENFRKLDRVAAETVWLRFVEGLSWDELARSQAREVWRVRADCDFGLRWMADRL